MIKVGSLIIENGTVYKVHRIEKANRNGNDENIIFYKPLSKDVHNSSLECSIPESSLEGSNIREIANKDEVSKFFKALADANSESDVLDFDSAVNLINLNDMQKSALAIKFFWKKTSSTVATSTKTDNQWLIKFVESVVEEISIVNDKPADTTRKKIKVHLNKYHKTSNSVI